MIRTITPMPRVCPKCGAKMVPTHDMPADGSVTPTGYLCLKCNHREPLAK